MIEKKYIKENENNSNISETNLLESIAIFFVSSAVADIHISDLSFKQMCLSIFRFINIHPTNKISEIDFLSTINSFNRNKLEYVKNELAFKKRNQLCQRLKGELCNIVADVGTYGGISRLICKVGRPYENRIYYDSQFEEENTFFDLLLKTDNNISSPKLDSLVQTSFTTTYSTSKILQTHKIHTYRKTVQWATPLGFLGDQTSEAIAKEIAQQHTLKYLVSDGTCKDDQFLRNDSYSPFLIKSYENVKDIKDYSEAFHDCIKVINSYGGIVGSITVDFSPVQIKSLSYNGELHKLLEKEIQITEENHMDISNEDQFLIKGPFKSFDYTTLPEELYISPPNSSHFEFSFNSSNSEEFQISSCFPTIFPLVYGCNSHLTHLSFIHVLKKELFSHNLVGNYKEIVSHLSYVSFRKLLRGRIPLYYQTRWLASFNGITFMKKKEEEIRDLFPGENLSLLNELFFFRKAIYPLIEHLRVHERDFSTPINAFSLASQLILLIRICQIYFKKKCSALLPFLNELSKEVYQKFIIDEKGQMNCLAFLLSTHGRDSYSNGYFQWIPPISSPFFNCFDFLFKTDELQYYSFGDEQKQVPRDKWLKNIVKQKPLIRNGLCPYLQSILSFFSTNYSNTNLNLNNKPEKQVNIKDSFTFEQHKKNLLKILSLTVNTLPWKTVFPNDKSEEIFLKKKRKRSLSSFKIKLNDEISSESIIQNDKNEDFFRKKRKSSLQVFKSSLNEENLSQSANKYPKRDVKPKEDPNFIYENSNISEDDYSEENDELGYIEEDDIIMSDKIHEEDDKEDDCETTLVEENSGFSSELFLPYKENKKLLSAYFGPLLEIGLTQNSPENENVLEKLLNFPFLETSTKILKQILKKNFNIPNSEISKAVSAFGKWLHTPSESLPFHSLLETGTREYWEWHRSSTDGWNSLSIVALTFSATMSSETAVERSLSSGKHLTGDRRYSLSLKNMDTEITLKE
jgi:hypothetical protein